MVDYTGNSKKLKEGQVEKKEIQRVVTGEVVVKKKSLGKKIKETFIEADFRSVAQYVVSNVLIPAARAMIVDSATKGVERMMYGDRAPNRGGYGAPRMTYGGGPLSPTNYRAPQTRPPVSGPRYPRAGSQDYVIPTREEAMSVLQMMTDVIEMYSEVSVAEYHEMLGLPINPIEHKWGWKHLVGSNVRPDRDGYILELPPAEPLQ